MKNCGFAIFAALLLALTAPAGWATPLRAALVLEGQLGDQSFFDSAHRGFQEAREKLGIRGQVLECNYDPANYLPYLATAARHNELVLAVGFGLQDVVEEMAPQMTDVDFVYYDVIGQEPDVTYAAFRQDEGSYLAGALAALMTGQNGDCRINPEPVIGIVIGEDMPVMREFLEGYEAGARWVRPDIQVLSGFVGSWEDPAAGKEMALNQFRSGADVIYQVAGATGEGVIAAAKEAGFYAIGVDSPQEHMAPGVVLTSMLKRLDRVTFDLIQAKSQGTFRRGARLTYGLKEGGVGLSWTQEALQAVPARVKAAVDELEARIASGAQTVKSLQK